MKSLYGEITEEKLQMLRTHPYFAKANAALFEQGEDLLKSDPPQLKFSELHLFSTTGDRSRYETALNEYRKRLKTYFYLYLLSEDEKYILPLSDIIWYYCNMESWALPAHNQERWSVEERLSYFDLVCSEDGLLLCYVLLAIGDKLPDLIRRKLRSEIRRRMVDTFKSRTFPWEKSEMNWSAVCVTGILGGFLTVGEPGELEEYLPRMKSAIEAYLRSFYDDGCCKEGYGYWSYGFSYFCRFAAMLKNATGEDLFDDPKVRAVAHFQENVLLTKDKVVSFSDCMGTFAPITWFAHLLKTVYPDVQIPAQEGTAEFLAIFENPDFANCEMHPKSALYPECQWLIHREDAYVFACKAGSNDEPHNHNDVGSFQIAMGGEISFTDPLHVEYTRQYFGPERYSILTAGSRGHSVPIIGGTYQCVEKTRATLYEATENVFDFSMEHAYPEGTVKTLERRFDCGKDAITLTDRFTFDEPKPIVERFVSFVEPKKDGDTAVCGNTRVVFDKDACDLVLGKEEFDMTHTRRMTLYFVDLVVKDPGKETTVKVRFENK